MAAGPPGWVPTTGPNGFDTELISYNSPQINAVLQNYLKAVGINASVIKNNRLPLLGEGGNLQLKFEFFNVLNRVNLGGVIADLSSFNFGKILSQGDPRVVQVGARISF